MRSPRITLVIDRITGATEGLDRRALESALRSEIAALAKAGGLKGLQSTARPRAAAEMTGSPDAASVASATLRGITS